MSSPTQHPRPVTRSRDHLTSALLSVSAPLLLASFASALAWAALAAWAYLLSIDPDNREPRRAAMKDYSS